MQSSEMQRSFQISSVPVQGIFIDAWDLAAINGLPSVGKLNMVFPVEYVVLVSNWLPSYPDMLINPTAGSFVTM